MTKNLEVCLICQRLFKSKHALVQHVIKSHNMTSKEYNQKFDLLKKCQKCGNVLAKKNYSGFCVHCRDVSGKNHPRYKDGRSSKLIPCPDCGKNIKFGQKRCGDCGIKFRSKLYTGRPLTELHKLAIKKAHNTLEVLEKTRKAARLPHRREASRRNMLNAIAAGKVEKYFNTKPERAFKIVLDNLKIKYKFQYLVPNVTMVDFFIPSLNLMIFIDGCYWHVCPTCNCNHSFDQKEKENTYKRDALIVSKLEKLGYKVKRIWEHEIKLTERFNKCLIL